MKESNRTCKKNVVPQIQEVTGALGRQRQVEI